MSTATSTIRVLLRYYQPYALRISLAMIFMLPASGISVVFPALTGSIIDQIIQRGSAAELVQMGLLFLGLLVVQGIVGYVVSITLATSTERAMAALRVDVFTRIVRAPLSTILGQRVGELTSRLSNDMSLIHETFSFSILQLVRQSVLLVGSLTWIIATSFRLTVPILVVLPVIVVAAVVLGRRIRALSKSTQEALSVTATIVEETLQAISSVKSYVRETYEIQRFSASIDENIKRAIKSARLRAAFVVFIIFVIFGGIAAVILYGAQLVSDGEVSIGQLLSFLMYAMFTGGALGSFAELFGSLQKSLGAAERIRETLSHDVEPDEDASGSVQRLSSVELRDVCFAYPARTDVMVVNGVTLSITSGTRVAFVGMSGAGKTTTASLIQGLYAPTSGTFLYDGVDAEQLGVATIRKNVGIVPQDIVLFGGTIEDNIRYGALHTTDQEILDAAKHANVMEFVQRFPDGLRTIVGDRGIALSGGQRQRVAIARALLKNPPILILDEATSSLDSESEKLIEDALETLMAGRTTIIIAHRLSTVRRCDVIHVFESGCVADSGSFDDLMSRNTAFRRWCDHQFVQ